MRVGHSLEAGRREQDPNNVSGWLKGGPVEVELFTVPFHAQPDDSVSTI